MAHRMQDEYPNYNFIGLLIGPRGNTQKRMQVGTHRVGQQVGGTGSATMIPWPFLA